MSEEKVVPNPDLARYLSRFLSYLELERGFSPHTVAAYGHDIQQFIACVAELGVQGVEEIRDREVFEFVVQERKKGLQARSVRRRLAAVRTFFRFLVLEGAVKQNPARLLDTPRIGQRLPVVLQENEMTRLLDAVQKPPLGRYPRRDRAILEVLYACGLRVSELIGLQLKDVHADLGIVRCFGKGSKERIVPISETALEALNDYQNTERPRLAAHGTSDLIFLSRGGKPLGREVVNAILNKNVRKAGLTGSVTPHTLRHSFATHLLHHGADLRIVQELLGHAKVDTTEIYTHIEKSELKEKHRKYHPRG